MMLRSTLKVAPTDPTDLIAWKKIDSRAMLIIMDGVKDHIVPHLFGKKTTLEMWKALEGLYQSKKENQKMVLYESMRSTKTAKGEGVVISQGSHISKTSLEQLALRLRMRS